MTATPSGASPVRTPQKPFYERMWFWTVMVAVIIVGIVGIAGNGSGASGPPPVISTRTTPSSAPQAEPQVFADQRTDVVYYKNCMEARAAGAAPIYRGQPGYRSGLDRDNDGIACES